MANVQSRTLIRFVILGVGFWYLLTHGWQWMAFLLMIMFIMMFIMKSNKSKK